jgi:hypothetical protein
MLDINEPVSTGRSNGDRPYSPISDDDDDDEREGDEGDKGDEGDEGEGSGGTSDDINDWRVNEREQYPSIPSSILENKGCGMK